jgi:tRNA pseudouridine55 synthase
VNARGRGRGGGRRDIDGVLLLDKPLGGSSNLALQRVRRLFNARKAGHCGSLDPLATGLLPICLGQATRFSSYLLGAAKTYRASCRLGQVTATGDAEGEIIAQRPVDVDLARVSAALAGFVGRIEQVPPMYSALKHEGRRLYELAREGREVERKPREVEIFHLELLQFDSPVLDFEVRCSSGTYVRTLAEDIGEALGCGAHLTALRRTEVDDLSVADACTLERIEALAGQGGAALDALLRPASAALARYPRLDLDTDSAIRIRHGKRFAAPAARDPGLYRLFAADGDFIGLGEIGPDGLVGAKRLMNTAR